jgi:hypothetical protein
MMTEALIRQAVLVLDEPFLKMHHVPGESLVILQWKGYASPENYRRGLDTALEFVKKNHVQRWLADLRQMDAILAAEERWTNHDWFPRLMREAQLYKMAILPSRDFFNQKSVERIMRHTNGERRFAAGYFETDKEAMDWLFDRASD